MWSTSLHLLSQLLLKPGTALLTEPAKNMSHIFASATFNSKTVFGFGLILFKNFVHHSSDVISPGNSNLESYSWPLFILSHLQTVRKPALLSNTYSVRRCGGSTKPSVATTESWLFASTGQWQTVSIFFSWCDHITCSYIEI